MKTRGKAVGKKWRIFLQRKARDDVSVEEVFSDELKDAS